jgi:hypothetical protein
MVGALFVVYVRAVGRESTLVFLGLCALIAGAGASLQLEPLIAGIAAGLVAQRALGEAPRAALLDVIREGATPVLVLFFTALGASIDVEAVANVGFAAMTLGATRVALLVAGTRIAARVARSQTPESSRLWRTLLPTSTMTLAFATTVRQEHSLWGPEFVTLVFATVAFFEVVAPIVLRASLDEAREIGAASMGGLVVVSNREPWAHEFGPDGSIVVRHTPGGVSVALDALMRERGGVWVAHGAGSADRSVVDERSSVEGATRCARVPAAPRVVEPAGSGRVLRGFLQQRALAAVSSGARAPAVSRRGLGHLPGGESQVRGHRRGGSAAGSRCSSTTITWRWWP